jgi:AP-1-like factor
MADYNALYQQSLYLSPEQQDLLLAALTSNNPPQRQDTNRPSMDGHLKTESDSSTSNNSPSQPQSANFDPSSSNYFESPVQEAPGSGHLEFGSDESPFLEFDPDADFEFSGGDQLIGDIPDFPSHGEEHESGEKRKSLDGKEEQTETGKKRRESEDKDRTAKKPGRKPLTSEPTSVCFTHSRASRVLSS